ncbi:MAG TPA: CBS domain-containing protein [Candidatus Bathyarchaeia archaeon]|jgi:CBS domain-containing protein|nr:CBS domain-containing protein [Candidatus Bathyarchaeia archaeon]
MKIEEAMIKSVITLQEDVSVHEAVKLMNENRIGCLVVLQYGQVAGIVTERDLLEKVLEKCRNPKETKVTEIMTKRVIVGKPDMRLDDAAKLMFEKKVKKLPIVEGTRLVGLVTLTDLARMASLDEKTMEIIETRESFLRACLHAWDTTLKKQEQAAVAQ